jgi:hypothetical protein
VLYVSAKVAGSFDPESKQVYSGHPTMQDEPTKVQAYLEKRFMAQNSIDSAIVCVDSHLGCPSQRFILRTIFAGLR